MQSQSLRRAIAMIELIFAIVVMGIVLLSAPTLIGTAKSSVNVALQQEAINEASSRVAMIMTYPWDENDTNASCIPPVLQVSSTGDNELNENGTTARRIGVPLTSLSRTFLCGHNRLNASTTLGQESGETTKDDMDDFNQATNLGQIDANTTGQGDYIETTTVRIATRINYVTDNANYASKTLTFAFNNADATQSTNIKGITVTLTSTANVEELNKTIVLYGFTCNIGGYVYEKRTF